MQLDPLSIDVNKYLGCSRSRKSEIVCLVEDRLRGKFIKLPSRNEQLPLPTFLHLKTELEFTWIPSGTLEMGLSIEEEEAALALASPQLLALDWCRPTITSHVRSLLVSTHCVLRRDYQRLTGAVLEPAIEHLPIVGLQFPFYATREEAVEFASRFDFRLPRESEWEYFCRGGTKTLFCWGDVLPSHDELGKWLEDDFSGMQQLNANDFGLFGLFCGDWCLESWRPNHKSNESTVEGEYVIRGGGSVFWPWQSEGWIYCVSAHRMPSSKLFEERRCGFRLIYDLC